MKICKGEFPIMSLVVMYNMSMEKPKILGVAERPTEKDLSNGRLWEHVSPLHALSDLVKNPEKTMRIADLIADPTLSQKLREIASLEKGSSSYETILMEALDTRAMCEDREGNLWIGLAMIFAASGFLMWRETGKKLVAV